MDWKRLVQFALLGSGDLEQYAILLVRVSVGLFFAISGANKLFVASSRQTMYETLVAAKVLAARMFAGIGCGVRWRMLAGCGVSFKSGQRDSIRRHACRHRDHQAFRHAKRTLPLNWLDDFLYLPEVLYVLFFIWLICSGPGKFSVDDWLAGKLAVRY